MVSIKSLVFSTALLVASASAASIEKRGGGWGTATYYYQNGNPVCFDYLPFTVHSADEANREHAATTHQTQTTLSP